MYKLLFCFFFICVFSYGQNDGRIIVHVTSKSDRVPVSDASVSFYEGDSLIMNKHTDSIGRVVFTYYADTTLAYSVVVHQDSFYNTSPAHFVPEYYEDKPRTILLDIQLLTGCKMYLPTLPYFEPGESKLFTQFEEAFFKSLFTDYRNLNIDIFYNPRENEKSNLQRTRTRVFKKRLKELGVDFKRINFVKKQPDWNSGCEGCFYSTISFWGAKD